MDKLKTTKSRQMVMVYKKRKERGTRHHEEKVYAMMYYTVGYFIIGLLIQVEKNGFEPS